MKSENSRVNFSEQTGITDDVLQAFLQGKLTEEQQVLFMRLLEEDEFARDAVAGWQSAAGEDLFSDTVERIQKRSGAEKRGMTIRFPLLLAAASLALLLGLGWWLWQMNIPEENIAQINPSETVMGVEDQPASDRIVPADKHDTLSESSTQAIPDSGEKAAANAVMTDKRTDEEVSKKQNNLVAAESPAQNTRTEEMTAEPAVAQRGARAEPSVPVAATEDATASTRTMYAETAANRDQAKARLEQRQYEQAAADYRVLLKEKPEDAELLYYGGIAEYILGNMNTAEQRFDQLLKGKRGYNEGSQWYKANILLKKGKKEEAVLLLKALSQKPGSYQERAAKKLQDLGDKKGNP